MSEKTNNLIFQNLQQVKTYAEQQNKTLLIYDDYILDVTTFNHHHPGGGVLLRNKHLKDIKQEMQFHHPLTVVMANTMAIGSFRKDIERIVNPDQPLSPQIWNFDKDTYMKLINSPHWMFVQSPRLFSSDFVEALTHNKWYHIPYVPCAMMAYFFYWIPSWQTFNLFTFVLTALAGILAFSFVEYCLHRFVFHSQQYIPDNRLLRYLHFFTHGLHHMLPNDPDRLVLPIPLFLVIYLVVVVLCLQKIIVIVDPVLYACFWSFFLVGYLIYDISHYALHHIDTTKYKGSWFHSLQKYHNRHHFSGQDAGFGVSSPLWDIVLRTGFRRKKIQ